MQWRGFLMPGIRTPYSVFCDLTHGYNFSGKNKCNHWHLHKTYTSGEEKNVKNGMCLEFNVQNLFSWQWLCLDLDKDWCLRKVELKIARTHIEQITAKAVIHSGGNVMMTWWQQNFKQITMCLKPLSSSIWPSTQVAKRTNGPKYSISCHRWTRLLPKFIIHYQ